MRSLRTFRLASAHAVRQDEFQEAGVDRPATEDEINQITGESDRWMPSLEEWILFLVIFVLVVVADSMMR